ncbi:MAG TPA: hypothetical protein VFG79_19270 [Solirubrobacter sp.]|nr:hypothetical protein [Solirubrobacter sp.]
MFLAGTHKWLGGPRGTGLIWTRAWDRIASVIPTFTPGGPGALHTPGGYHSFEHRWALAQAFATQYARLGTSLHIDESDVDAALAAVRALT